MATVNKVSKAQFISLYNNIELSAEQIAEQLGIPKAELARLAKGCNMPLNKRPKGKRVVYLFDEEETIEETTNDVVEVVVTPVETQHEVRTSNVVDMFHTIED